MARFELKLPKMGESVAEATITSWLKEVGDTIELDEAVVEIATDKVDSEVPSEVEGTLVEILFELWINKALDIKRISSENEIPEKIYAGRLNLLFFSLATSSPIDDIIRNGIIITSPIFPPILLIKSGIPLITPI